MLVPNNDELNAHAAPFQPQFLQQEMIFDRSYCCLSRASEEITCTKRVGFCLRRISGCECAILPVPEIATCSRCSVCELASSGERSTARQRQQILSANGKVSKSISQRGETTNPTQTLCHSCRGSYFRSKSLFTVRISLAHPSEEMRTGSLSQMNRRHRVRHLAFPGL